MLFNCYLQPHKRITIYRQNLTQAAAVALYEVFKAKGRANEVKFKNVECSGYIDGSDIGNYMPTISSLKFTEKQYNDERKPSGFGSGYNKYDESRESIYESSDRELRESSTGSSEPTDNTE